MPAPEVDGWRAAGTSFFERPREGRRLICEPKVFHRRFKPGGPVPRREPTRATQPFPSMMMLLALSGAVRARCAGTNPQGGRCAASFLMSFLRHGEICHFDEGAIPLDRAPAHRNDEFPAGYSSAGCSPALPASASPAGSHLAEKAPCSTMEIHRTANSVLTACLSPGDNRNPTPKRFPALNRRHGKFFT